MKSRKVLIVIICAVLVAAAAAVVLLSVGIGMSSGVCVRDDNGGCLIVLDGSPVSMHQRSGSGDMFSGFDTGDKVFIIHDGIAESYPGRTGVYFAVKLSDGDRNDVPEDVLESLRELGWISDTDSGSVIFYDQPTIEHTAPSGSHTVGLTEEQSRRLREIIGGVERWTDDYLTDRVSFFFDGEICLTGDEQVYWFCDEYDAIYYDHYFCSIPTEDMDYIMSLDPERG